MVTQEEGCKEKSENRLRSCLGAKTSINSKEKRNSKREVT
jgi:hypothetical protein